MIQRITLLHFFLLALWNYGNAQVIDDRYPQIGGLIYAIENRGDTVFLGGNFHEAYYKDSVKSGFLFSSKLSDTSRNGYEPYAKVSYSIYSMIPYENGEHIISGFFQGVDDSMVYNIAHLDSNGKLKNTFQNTKVTNVYAMDYRNDTLLMGGEFYTILGSRDISYYNGNGDTIPEDLTDKVNGTVDVIESDDNGGWYLGGRFTLPGDFNKKYAFVHILSDGAIDWKLAIESVGKVSSILKKDSYLVLGGQFSFLNKKYREGLAKINLADGEILDWEVTMPGNSIIYSLASIGDDLFFSGNFTAINGESRNRIASVDLNSGKLQAFDPHCNGYIYSILVSNDRLFIGGKYDSIGGQYAPNLAAFNKLGDSLFIPDVSPNNRVANMKIHDDYLYLVGVFTNPKSGILRYSLGTFQADQNWAISTISNPDFSALAIDNNTVYLSGKLQNYNGTPVSHTFGIDIATGKQVLWAPSILSPGKLAAVNGKIVLGKYGMQKGELRNRAAAIRVSTGELLDWDPGLNGKVESIRFSGDNIVIGGNFDEVGYTNPTYSSGLVCVDKETGKTIRWSINLTGGKKVKTMALNGNELWVGGSFTAINGFPYNGFAVLNASTGTVIYGDANLKTGTTINAIDFNGSNGYIGGTINYLGNNRSVLEYTKGTFQANDIFSSDMLGTVNCINVSGNILAIGGTYLKYQEANYLPVIVIDLASKNLIWHRPYLNGTATLLDMWNGRLIMAGGLSNKPTIPRKGLAAFLASTGELLDWAPSVTGTVKGIVLYKDEMIISGDITQIGDSSRVNLGALNIHTLQTNAWNPNPNGKINTMELFAGKLVVGGVFTKIDTLLRSRIAVYNPDNLSLLPTLLNANAVIQNFEEVDKQLYVSIVSNTPQINGVNVDRLCILDSNFNVHSWNSPIKNGLVYDVCPSNKGFYAGGYFDVTNSSSQSNFVEFNTTTDSVTNFTIQFDNRVEKVESNANILAVCGTFDYINQKYIRKFGIFINRELITLEKESLTPLTMKFHDNLLFVGGGGGLSTFAVYRFSSNLDVILSNDSLCIGSAIQVKNNSQLLDSVLWSFGDTPSNWVNQWNPSHTYYTSGDFTIQAYAFYNGSIRDSMTHSVHVRGSVSSLNVPTPSFCKNDSTLVEIQPKPAEVVYWKINSNIDNSRKDFQYYFKDSTEIEAVVKTQQQCYDTARTSVFVLPLPLKPLMNKDTGTIWLNQSYSTYSWTKDGNDLPSANDSFVTSTVFGYGVFQVRVQNQYACEVESDTLGLYPQGPNSISNFSLTASIFPNPFQEYLSINIANASSYWMEVYATDGRCILSEKLKDEEHLIQTENWKSGVYLIRITHSESGLSQTFKVIKAK